MNRSGWIRIIPFAAFMAFIGLQQAGQWAIDNSIVALTEQQLLYLYPIKALLVAVILVLFWRDYNEIQWSDLKQLKHTFSSLLVGLLVFVLWINMDWTIASLGENKGYDPYLNHAVSSRNILIGFRLFGAAIVVPIMEELFWRSFLLRYIINSDFSSIRIGTYTLSSFIVGALLFGLEHHLIFAGIMAGIAYSLLLYRTKSIAQCILSHAITNLVLGLYVLQTGFWRFW